MGIYTNDKMVCLEMEIYHENESKYTWNNLLLFNFFFSNHWVLK